MAEAEPPSSEAGLSGDRAMRGVRRVVSLAAATAALLAAAGLGCSQRSNEGELERLRADNARLRASQASADPSSPPTVAPSPPPALEYPSPTVAPSGGRGHASHSSHSSHASHRSHYSSRR